MALVGFGAVVLRGDGVADVGKGYILFSLSPGKVYIIHNYYVCEDVFLI